MGPPQEGRNIQPPPGRMPEPDGARQCSSVEELQVIRWLPPAVPCWQVACSLPEELREKYPPANCAEIESAQSQLCALTGGGPSHGTRRPRQREVPPPCWWAAGGQWLTVMSCCAAFRRRLIASQRRQRRFRNAGCCGRPTSPLGGRVRNARHLLLFLPAVAGGSRCWQ